MRIGDILFIIFIVVIMIVLLPIILPLAIFVYLKGKVDDIRFKRFLVGNEGANYFAYTDKQTSRKYVEDEILPFLPKDTRVLQLAGKKGRYNMGEDFGMHGHVVGSMKLAKGGFPYVSKIVDGELITESINNRLYSAIRRNIGAELIVEKILRFFDKQ